MRKELPYYTVENKLGWDQDDFRDPFMYFGGCGAVTACDLCIYLARERGLKALYPYNAAEITVRDYLAFSRIMKTYLRPRVQGINTLELWLEGFSDYLSDVGVKNLGLAAHPGRHDWDETAVEIKAQIDAGLIVPTLLLRHRDKKFKDISWHWFNIAGYEEKDDDLLVRIVTYGEAIWVSLKEIRDSGFEEKGGLIRIAVA